jgi:hypothetical protein
MTRAKAREVCDKLYALIQKISDIKADDKDEGERGIVEVTRDDEGEGERGL